MFQTIQVSEYESLLPSLVEVYRVEADDFQAGQLPYFVNYWRALTSDTEILETVTGQHIEFNESPVQINPPFQPCWGEKEACIIDTEISDLLSKEVCYEFEKIHLHKLQPQELYCSTFTLHVILKIT